MRTWKHGTDNQTTDCNKKTLCQLHPFYLFGKKENKFIQRLKSMWKCSGAFMDANREEADVVVCMCVFFNVKESVKIKHTK